MSYPFEPGYKYPQEPIDANGTSANDIMDEVCPTLRPILEFRLSFKEYEFIACRIRDAIRFSANAKEA